MITILGLSTLLQAQIRPQRVRVGENIAESLIAKMVQPIYPDEARSKSINGPVRMQVNISKSGDVESVKVLSGDPILAPAAVAAVKQWKYTPSRLKGEIMAMQTWVTVTFTVPSR